ncbi:MAG TPA: hypothetical protein PKD84_01160 [Propionicimonas sp.]|nr:hypothetical protein [Propionicimonas sp.]
MTPEEFRRAFESFRDQANRDAIASKSSHEAYVELTALYGRFDSAERAIADTVLIDWLESNDEAKRWDAEALIRDHRVVAAIPALRVLADSLEESVEPGAPYEWAKVNRLLGHLANPEEQP